MHYKVIPTSDFERGVKRLKKKYPSLKKELDNLVTALEKNARQGESLGKGLYKIRIAIKSKRKGKSGGGRIISYLIDKNKKVFLLSIYDKSEIDSLSESSFRNIIQEINMNN